MNNYRFRLIRDRLFLIVGSFRRASPSAILSFPSFFRLLANSFVITHNVIADKFKIIYEFVGEAARKSFEDINGIWLLGTIDTNRC